MSLRKKIIIAVTGLVILSGLTASAYFLFKNNPEPSYNFATVIQGDITEKVNLTGMVKPAESVDLAFERSAKIAAVKFKVGDTVKAGQVIVNLVSTDLIAQLSQAQATYNTQSAMLKSLRDGARPEDIQISKTQEQNAAKSVTDAQTNLTNVETKADNDLSALYNKSGDLLNDAYAKAFDALYNKTDGIFNNGSSNLPTLAISLNDSALANNLEQNRPANNQNLNLMKSEIDVMGSDPLNINQTLADALTRLGETRDYLNSLSNALNYAIISSVTPQAQILIYKSNLNSGLANLNSAIAAIDGQTKALAAQKITNQNSITSAEAQLNQANNNLVLAQNQLKLKQAGATADQIAAQAAQVLGAQAASQNVQAQLAKSTLISPIDGRLSRQDAKVGEIAPMNVALVSIISNAKFQIDAPVAEADIEKVKIGQIAAATLDADSSHKIFQAKVINLDPTKTVINGSSAYKITLEFMVLDPLIKDGLTANVVIITRQKNGSLLIPSSAIIRQYDQTMVLMKNNLNGVSEKNITTGISQNGLTEVMSGLSQGDQVASFGAK